MFLLKQLIGAGFTVSSGDGDGGVTDTYGSLVISHNPIGYWRLGESSGTVAADSSSNSPEHPGTYYNTPTLGQTGIVSNTSDTSVLFEQANQEYVETATFSGVTSLLPCTIECFIKTSGASDSYAGIVFYRETNALASGLNIRGSTLGKLGYHWKNAGNTYGYTGAPTLSDDTWYYVALVVESSKATFYAIEERGSVMTAVNSVTHTALDCSGDGWFIGRDSATTRYFQGHLDEVAIYDTALNRAKIESHALTAFGRYPSTTNLIFHVDASSVASYDSTQSPQPTTWTDLSGSGNDLDLTGDAGPPLYENSSGTESLEFEGAQNEHGIFTGSPENIPDIGGNEVTFNVWWKEEDDTNSSIIFLSSSTSSTSPQYRELGVYLPWSNTVYFDCGTDSGAYDRISKSTSGVTMTDWHMWTFTKNASTGYMKIYLDGSEWHSGTGNTRTITTPVAGSIGRRVVGSTSDSQVDGRIGEIQLYDAELSAATILSNYNATKSKYPDYGYLFTETFEGTNSDNQGTLGYNNTGWTTVVTTTNKKANPSYTTALAGGYSYELRMDSSVPYTRDTAVNSFTASTNVYMYFIWKMPYMGAVYSAHIEIQDASGNQLVAIGPHYDGLQLKDDGTNTATLSSSVPVKDDVIHFWIDRISGTSIELRYASSATRPSSAALTISSPAGTADAAKILLRAGNQDSGLGVYDNIIINNSSIGSDPL